MKNTKTKIATIALILTLTIASLMTFLPTVMAQKEPTTAYLYFRPNPIGIGQELLINAWIYPPPPLLDIPFPMPPAIPYEGLMYTITKPDGTIETIGPRKSDGPGTDWITIVPDQLGTWNIQFSFPGDETHTASTEKLQLTVQKDPIPSWPSAPLPTEPWNYPISPENREWYAISGPWLEPHTFFGRGYDSSGSNFNPYTLGPSSSHVLWKLPPLSGMTGLAGGIYGSTKDYAGAPATIEIVMAGKGYSQFAGKIHCIDIRTGEELWTAPGAFTVGSIEPAPSAPFSPSGLRPVLLSISNRFIKYDGLTGAILVNSTGIPTGFEKTNTILPAFLFGSIYAGFDYRYAYVWQEIELDQGFDYYMIKFDTYGDSPNFQSRIVWNVTFPYRSPEFGLLVGGFVIDAGVLVLSDPVMTDVGKSVGLNTTTGEILWEISGISFGDEDIMSQQKQEAMAAADGKIFYALPHGKFIALNITTGETVWISEQVELPWGHFWSYDNSVAYNQVYGLSYTGIYSFNISNGEINWHYSAGDSMMETPYGTWPFGSEGSVVADGKIYAPTTEHSPTLYYRGNQLHCVNAFTGKGIWSIMGYWNPTAVAEGTLFATNAYDGCSYAFGKGETATTVSVQNDVYAKGDSILIKGTVLDMSPAQPNTAAISDASMTDWMEYLHMQQPMPMDATGVSVTLYAIDPNNNFIDIGTATSNTDGNYGFQWTPEIEGKYEIIATFEGSESYYTSHATTYIGVEPAPSPAQPIEPEPVESLVGTKQTAPTEAPFITTEIAIIAVVAVAIVIGIVSVYMLRKQRK